VTKTQKGYYKTISSKSTYTCTITKTLTNLAMTNFGYFTLAITKTRSSKSTYTCTITKTLTNLAMTNFGYFTLAITYCGYLTLAITNWQKNFLKAWGSYPQASGIDIKPNGGFNARSPIVDFDLAQKAGFARTGQKPEAATYFVWPLILSCRDTATFH
jgi:hypothetical protein